MGRFGKKKIAVNGYVEQDCIKTISAKCLLTRAQIDELRAKYDAVLDTMRPLIRLILAGYEGRDDGIYEEIAPEMSKKKFFEAATEWRESIVKNASPRAMKASVFGDKEPCKSTGGARAVIGKLRKSGVFPIETGLSGGDEYNLIEQAIEYAKSWLKSDEATREAYADQQKDIKRLIGEAKKLALKIEKAEKKLEATNPQTKSWKKTTEIIKKSKREFGSVTTKTEKAEKRFERMKPFSKLELQNMDCTKYSTYLGTNYSPFKLKKEGDLLQITVTSSVMKGTYLASYGDGQYGSRRNNGQSRRDDFVPNMNQKRRRNLMFDCTVEPFGDGSLLRYEENGLRPRVAELKEPRLCWRRRNGNYELYLMMPVKMHVKSPEMFAGDHLAFSRYWPKEVEGLDSDTKITALGVDVGIIRSAYCVAVTAERFVDGLPTEMTVGKASFDAQTEKGREYFELGRRATMLGWLIKTTRRYKKDPKNEHNQIKESDVAAFDGSPGAFEHYILAVDEMSDDPLDVWGHANITGYGKWTKQIFKEFNQLKRERAEGQVEPNMTDDLTWCSLIDYIISLKKTLHFGGYETKERESFCPALYNERANCRDVVRKRLARYVVERAIAAEAQVISVENLSKCRRDDKRKNRVWDLMSQQSWIGVLTNMARMENIAVVSVNPDLTSQWVEQCGAIGDRKARTIACRDVNGKFVSLDADLNAAYNIASRALTRHAEPFSITFKKKDGILEQKDVCFDPGVIPVLEKNENEEKFRERVEKYEKSLVIKQERAVRWRAILQHLFGNERPWDEFTDEVKEGRHVSLYRHHGKLVRTKQYAGLVKEANNELVPVCAVAR